MSKVRLTATIACFQIRKNGRKSLSFTVRIYLNLQLSFFLPNSARNFFVCKQQRRRSASTVLPIISRKYQTCVQGGGGGGEKEEEGRIASRGRFVPVFLLGNKWQLMIFMGRSGPPAPSVSAHTLYLFYLFFCWAWSTPRAKTAYFFLRSKRPHTSITATCCFKVWGRT